jgi:hypothetical protein
MAKVTTALPLRISARIQMVVYCRHENYKLDTRSRFSLLQRSICLQGTGWLLI